MRTVPRRPSGLPVSTAKPASASRTLRAGRALRALGVALGVLAPAATWALARLDVLAGHVPPWLYLVIGAGLSMIPAGQAMIALRWRTTQPVYDDAGRRAERRRPSGLSHP